jgi:hypothetical protein
MGGPSNGPPTIDDLVDVARAAGRTDAGRRTIHYWVAERLVYPPQRVGRSYRYPLVSVGQVDTLSRWNRRVVGPGLIRFALFVEANTVPVEEALRIAGDELRAHRTSASAARAEIRDAASLQREATSAARRRGRHAVLPRRVRMSLDERTAAVVYLANQVLALDDLSKDGTDGKVALERALGLRSGRGGAERDVTLVYVPEDMAAMDPDRGYDAVRAATPEQAQLARSLVELFCVWFPAMIPTLVTQLPASDVPFLDIILKWAAELTPQIYVAIFAMLLTRTTGLPDEVVAGLRPSVDPPAATLEMLSGRAASEYSGVASRLRPLQRARFEAAMRSGTS